MRVIIDEIELVEWLDEVLGMARLEVSNLEVVVSWSWRWLATRRPDVAFIACVMVSDSRSGT